MTSTNSMVSLARKIASLLLGLSLGQRGGTQAATARRLAGDLDANAAAYSALGSLFARVRDAFSAAGLAMPSLDDLARVRSEIVATSFVASRPMALRAAAVAFCLEQEARVLSATTFASRDQVDALAMRFDAAFTVAEDEAATAGTMGLYRALVGLHAAVTHDLGTRGRPLPRMGGYALSVSVPALTLSNRLYGEAGRADELVRENGVFHPLFMPASGRALSA